MQLDMWLRMEILDHTLEPFDLVLPQDIDFADNPCIYGVPFEIDEFQDWPWEIKTDGRCDRAN